MEEIFEVQVPSTEETHLPALPTETRPDPLAFGSDEVDMELVRKKQEVELERENAMRTKATEEQEKKQARITKGQQELTDALK